VPVPPGGTVVLPFGGVQLPVFESQHLPPMHASPPPHLFIIWQGHPSEPALHMPPVPGLAPPGSPPVAAPGISHLPETQTPLAQSAPTEQLVFGSDPEDSQTPAVHLPLTQSLACEHVEPGKELPED